MTPIMAIGEMCSAVMALFEVPLMLIRPVTHTPKIFGAISLAVANRPLKGYRPKLCAIG